MMPTNPDILAEQAITEAVEATGYLVGDEARDVARAVLAAFASASTIVEDEVVVPRELLADILEAAECLDEKHDDKSDIWESAAAMSIRAGTVRALANLISAAPKAVEGEGR